MIVWRGNWRVPATHGRGRVETMQWYQRPCLGVASPYWHLETVGMTEVARMSTLTVSR